MNVIFMGTPQFAVPVLEALLNSKHKVVAVVTQTDKPVGRSKKPVFSPIKELAIKENIKVFQFEKIRKEGVSILKEIDADIIVTCAYGQILNKDILFMKKYGVINVHASLLPKYRGASPIQWAIIEGEETTGITILKSDIGIDDGKVLCSSSIDILENETAGELSNRLSALGAKTLLTALDLIEKGTAEFVEQDHSKATICKMFKSDFGRVDFSNSAKDIINLIHGLNPSPIAYLFLEGKRYKIFRAKLLKAEEKTRFNLELSNFNNGEIVLSRPKFGLVIKASDDFVYIQEIQAENGKVLDIKSFLNGNPIKENILVENE